MLTLSFFCSPSASSPDPKRQEVAETGLAGDDVPTDEAAETAVTDPSTTSAGVVTVAVAGTAQQAGVTPPLATSTIVETPLALRVKKPIMKKSSL
jgi:hypothetical protein